MVFYRFAHGMISDEKGPSMTSHDMRNFLRLSGLKRFFPNASCDLLYIKMTREFNITRSSKKFIKIRFNDFYKTLLKILGKSMHSNCHVKQAFEKIFEERIYPNLVSNLPYLGQRFKVNPNFESTFKGHAEGIILKNENFNILQNT